MTYTYKKLKSCDTDVELPMILRKEDMLHIPKDEANTDYQEYLKWLNGEDPYTEKGTPEAAD